MTTLTAFHITRQECLVMGTDLLQQKQQITTERLHQDIFPTELMKKQQHTSERQENRPTFLEDIITNPLTEHITDTITRLKVITTNTTHTLIGILNIIIEF